MDSINDEKIRADRLIISSLPIDFKEDNDIAIDNFDSSGNILCQSSPGGDPLIKPPKVGTAPKQLQRKPQFRAPDSCYMARKEIIDNTIYFDTTFNRVTESQAGNSVA